MSSGMHLALEGSFSFHKGKLGSNGETLTREFLNKTENMVLDTGLARIAFNGDFMDYIHLGTGLTAPHPLQATLTNKTYSGNEISPIGGTVVSNEVADLSNPYCKILRTFRVSPRGVIMSYTEVGVGWDNNNLFSRSLIKDTDNNPTTIHVLGDEYLDVTYEFRMYIPTGTSEATITPTGDTTTPIKVTVKAAAVTTSLGWSDTWGFSHYYTYVSFGLFYHLMSNAYCLPYTGPMGVGIDSKPQGTAIGSRFNMEITNLGGNRASLQLSRGLPDNVGTWKSLLFSSGAICFQCEFEPAIVKTDEEVFQLTFEITWGRA